MPSGASLGSRGPLRRSKSARSIRKQPSVVAEPLDPDLANHYALAAASLAMRRSAGRSSTDSQNSYDPGSSHRSAFEQPRRPMPPNTVPAREVPPVPPTTPTRQLASQDTGSCEKDWTSSAALSPITEFYGLDGRDSSLPSSYRRLRKSRSMFSTRQRSSRTSYGVSSTDSYPQTTSERLQSSYTPRIDGTLRRSMSFLRGGHQAPDQHTLRRAKSHAAVELARSQFQQNPAPVINPRRHFSFAGTGGRRGHKPFRRSFRSMSTSEYDAANTPLSTSTPARSVSSHKKTRMLSTTIKNRIKRVLGLSRPHAGSENQPPSQRARGLEPHSTAPETDCPPEDVSPHRVMHPHGATSSRPPTVRTMRSSESLASSRSRVTSWADSTVANTITTQRAGGRGKLAAIDERTDAPSRPSPSSPIDSQGLFAALMKRIGKSSPQSSDEEVIIGQVKQHRAIPSSSTVLRSRGSRRTIRQVPSDESLASPGSFTTAYTGAATPRKPPRVQSRSSLPVRKPVTPRKMASQVYDSKPAESLTPDMKEIQDGTRSPDSPSVYSRATSDDSPAKKRVVSNSSGSENERGMATIFASQRAAYSSPRRSSDSLHAGAPVRPSADWQQWMHSEIARIEIPDPRNDHYKEDTQIHDEGSVFACSVRGTIVEEGVEEGDPSEEPKEEDPFQETRVEETLDSSTHASNNLSQPLSRSSSIRTVVRARRDSTAQSIQGSPGSYSLSVSRTRNRDRDIGPVLSPVRPTSSNRSRIPVSPAPKRETDDQSPKWMDSAKFGRYPPRRHPLVLDGRSPQFRSPRTHRDHRKLTNENLRADDTLGKPVEPYSSPSKNTATPMSSKRMVEMFLDSRRRQAGTDTSDGGASVNAFI